MPARDERPEVGAQVAQVEAVGPGQLIAEEGVGARQFTGVGRHRRRRADEEAVELGRVQPHEEGVEAIGERFRPGEDADLVTLGRRARPVGHLARSQEDQRRRTVRRLGDEERSMAERQPEILGDDRGIADREAAGLVERETIEPRERGERLLIHDRPRGVTGAAGAPDVHPPAADHRPISGFDEQLEQQLIAGIIGRALEPRPVALADDRAGHTGGNVFRQELGRSTAITRLSDQLQVAGRLAASQRLFDPLDERRHGVLRGLGRLKRRPGERAGGGDQGPRHHGHQPRPRSQSHCRAR